MKKVLVTGGNAGIGFALCKQLATEDGCHVYLGSRNEEKGKKAVASILEKAPDAKVELVVVDVGSDDSVRMHAFLQITCILEDNFECIPVGGGSSKEARWHHLIRTCEQRRSRTIAWSIL